MILALISKMLAVAVKIGSYVSLSVIVTTDRNILLSGSVIISRVRTVRHAWALHSCTEALMLSKLSRS